jgi:putative endonuclease
MKKKQYYVYILTNKRKTVLYVGVTNNLERRVTEHKNKINKGFTYRYNIDMLVYFEIFDSILDAINREKQIKGYSRDKKEKLINSLNCNWENLFIDGKINFDLRNKQRDS